jgi:hypothetical protein
MVEPVQQRRILAVEKLNLKPLQAIIEKRTMPSFRAIFPLIGTDDGLKKIMDTPGGGRVQMGTFFAYNEPGKPLGEMLFDGATYQDSKNVFHVPFEFRKEMQMIMLSECGFDTGKQNILAWEDGGKKHAELISSEGAKVFIMKYVVGGAHYAYRIDNAFMVPVGWEKTRDGPEDVMIMVANDWNGKGSAFGLVNLVYNGQEGAFVDLRGAPEKAVRTLIYEAEGKML